MRDAVAEVLAERRGLVPRRSPSVVVSLLVHLGIAALILAGSRSDSVRPATQVLNIRLAPPPVTVAPPPVVEAPAAPAPALPAPVPVEEPKPEKAAEKKTPKKPVEKALFGKSTEKPSPPVRSPEARAATPPPVARPAGAGPGTGIAGLEGGDFPYTIYIQRMLTLIGSNWPRPQSQREVITQVYFVIERDGRVRDVKIEKESGILSFDRAALRAVLESSPLPPLPFAYSGTYLGVHLTFH